MQSASAGNAAETPRDGAVAARRRRWRRGRAASLVRPDCAPTTRPARRARIVHRGSGARRVAGGWRCETLVGLRRSTTGESGARAPSVAGRRSRRARRRRRRVRTPPSSTSENIPRRKSRRRCACSARRRRDGFRTIRRRRCDWRSRRRRRATREDCASETMESASRRKRARAMDRTERRTNAVEARVEGNESTSCSPRSRSRRGSRLERVRSLSKKKATGIRLRCVFGPLPLARRAWRFEDSRVANRRRSSLLSAFAPSFRRSQLTVFVSVSLGLVSVSVSVSFGGVWKRTKFRTCGRGAPGTVFKSRIARSTTASTTGLSVTLPTVARDRATSPGSPARYVFPNHTPHPTCRISSLNAPKSLCPR